MVVAAAQRESKNRWAKKKSAENRALPQLPDIANVERRAAARANFRLFCETYNPEAFYLGWSDDHLSVMERIQESVIHGALYAFAMPRGSGKTTLCRMGTLYAIAYSWRRYPFLIGANEAKAVANLNALKTFIRFLPAFADDFPEIAFPLAQLEGIARRCAGQTDCDGNPTMTAWERTQLVLPTIGVPGNWQTDWPVIQDGGRVLAPTSGTIIGVSGLTGEGIRGSVCTTTTGEQLRPDLVLLDDPQTDESARSVSQNAEREALIAGAVLGMAGPGKTISAVMPCTVIRRGDMVDSTLDRQKHPLWRGERTKLLRSMPSDMTAWENYFEVYRACALKEPPDFSESNAYYIDRREQLESGAVASWPERKGKDEESAIQSAMHLYCRNPITFMAEYQNDPLDETETSGEELRAEQIVTKLNGLKRGMVPLWATHLTLHIDVQGAALFWQAVAWSSGFDGAIVDYGCYPEQGRKYFTLRDLTKTLIDAAPGTELMGSIFAGLQALCDKLMGKEWPREDGGVQRVNLCMVDANWGASTNVVYQFCRQSKHASVLMPAHGQFYGANGKQWDHKPKAGEWMGLHCRVPAMKGNRAIRHMLFDTNFWKSFVAERIRTAQGDHGCLTIFGEQKEEHRMLADQLTAEKPYKVVGKERTATEWRAEPNRDNHWWDNLVACAVAACRLGCMLPGTLQVRSPTGRRPLRKGWS